ncbi:hypothetical protein SEA_DIANE_32 [Streptomyces phage Diane]|uniref:Uncharacterized protein n=1 Tax=Streptomyces phage Diane TaxID=2041207 RepID=A0A291LHE6_9CAUD|nr:hypothetical protein KGG78_gp32 [Streptomyces phage Diane]ATI18816.1 hypothetical protein SEA_DIANE_32 [Streptomyces phage Diane]
MSETTVTIKYGKGYDDTWAVFKGTASEIRANILDFFGMDPETQVGLSLSSVVVNATNIAHSKGLIATALGATVVEEKTNEPAKPTEDPWAAASAAQSSGPWPESASVPEKKEDPNAYILGEIEKQTTREGLKKLWAANQSFFADSAVMDAWKAKGKSLPA